MPVPAITPGPGLAGPIGSFTALCVAVACYVQRGGVIMLRLGGVEVIVRSRQDRF
jgi:hypothetical protein